MTLKIKYDKLIKPHMLGHQVKCFKCIYAVYSEFYRKGRCQIMYAIIETGGKQYQVKEGDVVFIEKLNVTEEDKISFDKVIVLGKEDGLAVGAPYVAGATVDATVLKNGIV